MVILQYRQLILKSTKKHRKLAAKCASSFCVQKAVANVDEGLTHRDTHTQIWFVADGRTNVLHPEIHHWLICDPTCLPFHLFRNGTMAIPNKKPMSIHNEWAQPNSFPWCEIVLSTRNHWSPRDDKKHPYAFLIDPSSLKARKSLYASDHPSLETGNNVGATLEMLMRPAEERFMDGGE